MAPGIILWLDKEYYVLGGDKRERSNTEITRLYEQMLNQKAEIPIRGIITS